jgi:hypothetical protein
MPYAQFLNPGGSNSYFMEDNFYLEDEINLDYVFAKAFVESYDTPHFGATHIFEQYPLTDEMLPT